MPIGPDAAHPGPERNLPLIPVHQALASAFVWIPVIVLYTRSRFGLDGALLLSSLYYLFVVALEVPSGWMSDRLGRVVTLRVAAVSFCVAQACFLVGDRSFPLFVLGQLALAGGFASLSGTDVTFHYDTLEALGRAEDYPGRQARVAAIGFMSSAASAVVGGVVGLISLRSVFAVALALAVAQLGVALALVEPGPDAGGATAGGFVGQIAQCLGALRQRYLGWIFAYGVVLVTLEHAAFSVFQPWLTELLGRPADDVGSTPVLSGVLYAATALVGAASARASAPLAERFGTPATLLALGALSALIVTGMAWRVAPAVLALMMFRSAQGAAAPVLISDAVASRVERRHRATLLSLDSLGGRLGWGLVLLALSRTVGDRLEPTLDVLAVLSWALVGLLVVSAMAVLGTGRPGAAGRSGAIS